MMQIIMCYPSDKAMGCCAWGRRKWFYPKRDAF